MGLLIPLNLLLGGITSKTEAFTIASKQMNNHIVLLWQVWLFIIWKIYLCHHFQEGTWHNWLFGNLVNMKKDELGVDLTKVAPKLHFLYCGFIFLWYLVVRFVFAALLLSRNTTPNQMKLLMLLLQRENAIPISTFDKYPVWPFASAVSAEVSLAEK